MDLGTNETGFLQIVKQDGLEFRLPVIRFDSTQLFDFRRNLEKVENEFRALKRSGSSFGVELRTKKRKCHHRFFRSSQIFSICKKKTIENRPSYWDSISNSNGDGVCSPLGLNGDGIRLGTAEGTWIENYTYSTQFHELSPAEKIRFDGQSDVLVDYNISVNVVSLKRHLLSILKLRLGDSNQIGNSQLRLKKYVAWNSWTRSAANLAEIQRIEEANRIDKIERDRINQLERERLQELNRIEQQHSIRTTLSSFIPFIPIFDPLKYHNYTLTRKPVMHLIPVVSSESESKSVIDSDTNYLLNSMLTPIIPTQSYPRTSTPKEMIQTTRSIRRSTRITTKSNNSLQSIDVICQVYQK